jgi:TPR repeat protein
VYSAGSTVVKNEAEAFKWWRRAADQNNAEAQYTLGLAYFLGKGVREDRVMAYMWCNLAAAQDFQKAAELRDNLAKEMSSQQISDAQKLSAEWKPVTKSP